MNIIISVCIVLSIIGLVISLTLYRSTQKKEPGNEKMVFISQSIREGAMAFLYKEYAFLMIAVMVGAIILGLYKKTWELPIAFILGSLLPAISGFVAMKIATLANTRTTCAAEKKGLHSALFTAFNAASVMGITGTSLGLLGVIGIYLMSTNVIGSLVAFGFGACVLGLFSRVGGGIYTKAADVGADLVGKIEAGIPEDDPRNPAVIADNVGDNVGDIAGMGADIFASYVNAIIATMLLGFSIADDISPLFPLVVMAVGFLSSLLTMLGTNLLAKNIHPHQLVRYAPLVSSALTIIGVFGYIYLISSQPMNVFQPISYYGLTVCCGIIGGIFIGSITEYFTSGKPVRSIAKASEAGGGSNVIRGLSVGMESSFLPSLVIIAMVVIAYSFLGIYGIGLAAVGMLSTMAITTSIDGYGPISDNAGGIAEMAGLEDRVRDVTDTLDAVGNTTAAIGKGFAIGSTSLTALALIGSLVTFSEHPNGLISSLSGVTLADPYSFVGMLLGGIIIFLFSSLTMKAVGDTALCMVEEVRRQFRTIPGLMEGTATPDYKSCVGISTRAALTKMLMPGILTILIILVGIFVFPAHREQVLMGIIIGTLIIGIFMAFFMSNAGGAWDNAKKFIEAGKLEGHKKGSDAHKSAVIGDTVGDPFKDTSGPSLNIVIKFVITFLLLILTTMSQM